MDLSLMQFLYGVVVVRVRWRVMVGVEDRKGILFMMAGLLQALVDICCAVQTRHILVTWRIKDR
ncbi:hypothetical protein B5V03_34755 [Bradyrhizobium betae]|uniref:Uncharacterized protein n=1 Tax=Bradyrhizobium betae TaxID=244734 RepID=A0A4Q1UL25_9BRAD|nr:hypothetical protein B5V03_34755 [Bradyrhizobium betae]